VLKIGKVIFLRRNLFTAKNAEDAKEEKGSPRVDADDRALQGEKRKQLAVSNESEAEFFTTEGTEDTDEQSGHIYPKVYATRAP
jgi:hypothetical protein